MTSQEIRNSFLEFFRSKQHTIVPSSPVVPYDDPTLLFTNAGMNQFKDVFLGTGRRDYKRAADTQKCIRVSGKHNDLEEVGRDTYHHTFFEMLGNWSFGDYYKKEAIAWAWELLTNVWGIPKNRLWATVYKEDDEAESLWKTVTDIDPSHVLRFGEKENFWEMGETGPCGPCSEIHIDRTENGTATQDLINAGLPDVMEIWNLVFIQYNRDEAGTLSPLPSKHVDTGMGFERVCAVLQNRRSNYDTDVFLPIIHRIADITRKPYAGSAQSMPAEVLHTKAGAIDIRQSEIDVAMRVIADHVRTLTFAIGDGALPSNEGRGYVLRRILRRAARFGRTLGMHEPFMYQLVPTLVETMSYIFPEIKSNEEHIRRVIKGEEEGFNLTLDRGLEIFESVVQEIGHSKTFPGEDAFKLYDTFGFPLDLTELMAAERGLRVDVGTFTELMEEQRTRSRDSGKQTGGPGVLKFKLHDTGIPKSDFTGYESFEETKARVLSAEHGYLVLDRTPFYAESGGQIGDTGELIVDGTNVRVLDTQKDDGVFAHMVEYANREFIGKGAIARVNKGRRLSIMRNHTATHVVHEALRRVLGNHLHQAGSLVAPDYLRFDFNHFEKVSPDQLKAIEEMVNEKIAEGLAVHSLNDPKEWVTIEEAKKRWPNVKMFFGEKYGERVRVVTVGDFSAELCGGTHLKNTSEIGYFKFRSEGSVAAGIRRIEAVTADYALELLKLQEKSLNERLDHAFAQLEAIADDVAGLHAAGRDASAIDSSILNRYETSLEQIRISTSVADRVSRNLDTVFFQQHHRAHQLETIILQIAETKKSLEKELIKTRLQSMAESMDTIVSSAPAVHGFKVASAKVASASVDELKSLGDTLRAKLRSGVGILGTVIEDKAMLVCVVTDDLVSAKRADAGKIVGAVARIVGGGGGGRPHMATAGGKDIARLDEAIGQVKIVVESLTT